MRLPKIVEDALLLAQSKPKLITIPTATFLKMAEVMREAYTPTQAKRKMYWTEYQMTQARWHLDKAEKQLKEIRESGKETKEE